MNNNGIIYAFITFFILLGVVHPLIATEFNREYSSNDIDGLNEDVNNGDVTSANVFTVLLAVILWVIGAPVWFNLIILLPMRIIFWVVVYDKIRGIH